MTGANNEAIDAAIDARSRAFSGLPDRQIVGLMIEAAAVHLTDAGQPLDAATAAGWVKVGREAERERIRIGHPPISDGQVDAFWKAYKPAAGFPDDDDVSVMDGDGDGETLAGIRAGLEAVQFALLDQPAPVDPQTNYQRGLADGRMLEHQERSQAEPSTGPREPVGASHSAPVDGLWLEEQFADLGAALDKLTDALSGDRAVPDLAARLDQIDEAVAALRRDDVAWVQEVAESYRKGRASGQQVLGELVHADTGPTDYEVWADALQAAATNMDPVGVYDSGTVDPESAEALLVLALWFREQLKRPIRDAPHSEHEREPLDDPDDPDAPQDQADKPRRQVERIGNNLPTSGDGDIFPELP